MLGLKLKKIININGICYVKVKSSPCSAPSRLKNDLTRTPSLRRVLETILLVQKIHKKIEMERWNKDKILIKQKTLAFPAFGG